MIIRLISATGLFALVVLSVLVIGVWVAYSGNDAYHHAFYGIALLVILGAIAGILRFDGRYVKSQAKTRTAKESAKYVDVTFPGDSLIGRVRRVTLLFMFVALVGIFLFAMVCAVKGAYVPALVFGALGIAMLAGEAMRLLMLDDRRALVISANGIDDRVTYGLIEWPDVEGISLYEAEQKGVAVRQLTIYVVDVKKFHNRLKMGRRLMRLPVVSLALSIPLNRLDQPARLILRACEYFCRQSNPGVALHQIEDGFFVDKSARFNESLEPFLARIAAAAQSGSAARVAEAERAMAEHLQSIERSTSEKSLAAATQLRKTKWIMTAVMVFAVVVAVLAILARWAH